MKRRAPLAEQAQASPQQLRDGIQAALQACPIKRIVPILGWQRIPDQAAPSGILRLTMVLHGTRHVRVPQPKKSRLIALNAGDMMVIAPSAWSRPRVRVAHQCLNIDCFPDFTRFVYRSHLMPPRSVGEGVFHSGGPMAPVARHLLQALANACEITTESNQQARLRPILDCFIAEVLGECRIWETVPSGLPDWQRAVSLMHEELGMELSREHVAERIGVHPNHLSRLCKRFTGSSLSHYLTNVRITRACGFLHDVNVSIAQVAASSGYHDETHFRKRFKQVIGVTPSQWRRGLR